jgi:hypothetical protein
VRTARDCLEASHEKEAAEKEAALMTDTLARDPAEEGASDAAAFGRPQRLARFASRGRGRAHRVFHPLVGADLRTLGMVLLQSGGIRPSRWHVPSIALATAALRLPFTVAERAALGWQLRGCPELPAPVFIIGHWRSGTTHLANLLSRSPRFGILPPIAVGLPWEAMTLARVVRPLVEQFYPRDRLIDAIPLAPDLPQEDELALANMTTLSFYHAIYFPRAFAANFTRGLFFEDCSEAEIDAWARMHRRYVAKMTIEQGGRPLLIRNPVHSGRIPLLRKIWPNAKFIHIHRNPFDVYASSRRMFGTLLRELSLQDTPVDLDRVVLETYPRLMSRLLKDAASLPPDVLAEISFAELREEPIQQLRRVFTDLDLPGFEDSRQAFGDYLTSVRDYRPSEHRLAAAQLDRVAESWRPFIERWGYSPPARAARA